MSDDEFQDYDYGSDLESGEGYSEEFEEEGKLMAEISAFERIGGIGDLMVTTDLMAQDPTDRFKIKVNGISRDLKNNRHVSLNEDDIKNLLEKVSIIKEKGFNIAFINPSAYVLGYIASKGGRQIDNKEVQNIFLNVLKLVESVTQPDVIRYARFHINLNK